MAARSLMVLGFGLALASLSGCASLQGLTGRGGSNAERVTNVPPLDADRNLDRAVIEAQKRLADKPAEPELRVALGNAYLDHGWASLAADEYEAALEQVPDNAAYWNNLALARLRLKDLSGGQQALRQALELDDSFAAAHYNLATTYEQRREFSSAMRHYRLALIADPTLSNRVLNPQARLSHVLLPAQLSLYLDSTGSQSLQPIVPVPPVR